MLIDVNRYAPSLKKLWREVFGDSDEYISLIFDNGYIPAEVFGEISDGEVVSALYLLNCDITSEIKSFPGRYLYAAATLPEYRKNGIMGRLINEAKEYVKTENIDFIALVPASEELYDYYSKFGYESLMYKYFSKVENTADVFADDKKIFIDNFLEIRKSFKKYKLDFGKDEMKYALSCLNFAGYNIYRNSEDSYYISDKKRTEVIEYISSEEKFEENTKLLLSKLSSGAEISSPYDMSGFCESEIQKFGMVFTENNDLKTCISSGIYMNIALD